MKWILFLLALVFTGLVVRALIVGHFFIEGGQLVNMAWGLVALADLYLGFLLFSIFIFLTERKPLVSVALTLLLFILGNGVAAVWLAFRYQAVKQRLSSGVKP